MLWVRFLRCWGNFVAWAGLAAKACGLGFRAAPDKHKCGARIVNDRARARPAGHLWQQQVVYNRLVLAWRLKNSSYRRCSVRRIPEKRQSLLNFLQNEGTPDIEPEWAQIVGHT